MLMQALVMATCSDTLCFCSGKKPEKFYIYNENDNSVLFKIEDCYTVFLFVTVLVDLLEKCDYEKWHMINSVDVFLNNSVMKKSDQEGIIFSKRFYPNFTKKKQIEIIRLNEEQCSIISSKLKHSLCAEYWDALYNFDAVATSLAEKYSDELEVFEKTKNQLNNRIFRHGKTYEGMHRFVVEETAKVQPLLENCANILHENVGPLTVQYNLDVEFMSNFFYDIRCFQE